MSHRTLSQVAPSTTIYDKHNFSIEDKKWATMENFNQTFIFGIVNKETLNTYYPVLAVLHFIGQEALSESRWNQEIDRR